MSTLKTEGFIGLGVLAALAWPWLVVELRLRRRDRKDGRP